MNKEKLLIDGQEEKNPYLDPSQEIKEKFERIAIKTNLSYNQVQLVFIEMYREYLSSVFKAFSEDK